MTAEYVLILGIFAFVLLGAFVGDKGPGATFLDAGPRLAARVERNVAVGSQLKNAQTGQSIVRWLEPRQR